MTPFLSLAGLPITSELDGQDLTALLRDSPEQRFVFGENYRSNRLITTGGAYVTDGHCKYIWNSWPGRELLFDLDQDPQELHDLSGDGKYRDTLLQMRQIVIDEYRTRPVDEMPDENGQLKAGRVLPAYRPERNGAPFQPIRPQWDPCTFQQPADCWARPGHGAAAYPKTLLEAHHRQNALVLLPYNTRAPIYPFCIKSQCKNNLSFSKQ